MYVFNIFAYFIYQRGEQIFYIKFINNVFYFEITFIVFSFSYYLENMMWLKKNNCPWDENTFDAAAENGNLKNMMWLRENNCPWDEGTFEVAANKKGTFERIFENMLWLKNNGCPSSGAGEQKWSEFSQINYRRSAQYFLLELLFPYFILS